MINLQLQIYYTNTEICSSQERIQDFKLGGGALKKIAPSGGRREHFWGISCEKSRFYAKKSYFFSILGRPPPWIRPACIRIFTEIYVLRLIYFWPFFFQPQKKDISVISVLYKGSINTWGTIQWDGTYSSRLSNRSVSHRPTVIRCWRKPTNAISFPMSNLVIYLYI